MNTVSPMSASAPHWDIVPFDVGCARCGHDLRGLAEPLCPACGLTFDWSVAVPIEELTCLTCGYHLLGLNDRRCPECGTTFTWDEVLAGYHRRQMNVFEYQWGRRPLRSLLRTWRLALRPHRLWAEFSIHDPPRVVPLLVMLAIALLALYALQALMYATITTGGLWSLLQPNYAAYFLSQALDALTGWQAVQCLGPPAVYFATIFLSFFILRQTMAQCRIRAGHLVRMCVLSAVMIWPVLALIVWLSAGLAPCSAELLPYVVIPFGILHVMYALQLGSRVYLRIPHAISVTFVNQLIATLTVLWFSVTVTHPQVPGQFVRWLYY